MLDYLLNKTAVFYGPRRLGGIIKNRLMVRLGFIQLDILPDSCLKDNVPKIGADIRHCSADSEIAIDRVDDRFYTTGPNLLLLRGAHHVRTG
jgi:hypothetical protein